MSLVSIASLSLAGIVAIDFQQALPMVGTITDVAYVHVFKKGNETNDSSLDGRSIFHRMHMQYQCEQQPEWFLALSRIL